MHLHIHFYDLDLLKNRIARAAHMNCVRLRAAAARPSRGIHSYINNNNISISEIFCKGDEQYTKKPI